MADIESIGRQARQASQEIGGSSFDARNSALSSIIRGLTESFDAIVAANAEDLQAAKQAGLEGAIVKVCRYPEDYTPILRKSLHI